MHLQNTATTTDGTKTCTACGLTLPLSAFGRHARRKDGRDTQCRTCKVAATLRWRATTSKGRARAGRRLAVKAWIQEQKAATGCIVCGEREPICLDFHHRNPEDKRFRISHFLSDRRQWERPSYADLTAELVKCVVLCANCHRKVHAGLLCLDEDRRRTLDQAAV